METHRTIRDQLQARAALLVRRLEGMDGELRQESGAENDLAARLAQLLEAGTRELALIQVAFGRMADREYGSCTKCAEPIPRPRLELMPYALLCAECACGLDMDHVDQLRTQHWSLRRLLRAIESELRALTGAARGPRTPERAIELIEDLSRELPQHFALEEQGGYLSEVVLVAPRFAKQIRELRVDHERFVRRSAALHTEARAAGSDHPDGWPVVAEAFAELARDIGAHESAESRILTDAFLSDLGQGG